MATYGVSPYAMPADVALGCMMNLRMAQAWKAVPLVTAISIALGNKSAISEWKASLAGDMMAAESMEAADIIEELKLQGKYR